jgi:hypothetical protein
MTEAPLALLRSRTVSLSTPSQPSHAWLAAILPETARRFRIDDPRLATTLIDAGAEVVETEADVEIVGAPNVRGGAGLGGVALERMARDDVSRVGRVAARIAGPIALLRDVAVARASLRRHGYKRVAVATWDFGRPFLLGGTDKHRRTLAERLPRHAVVVGYGAETGRTLLDAVAVQASAISGGRVDFVRPSVRAGVLVSVAENGVLRTAVGPARNQIVSQLAALEQLRAMTVVELDTEVIPWPLGAGRVGLADWSLEQRLGGGSPSAPLNRSLLRAALDFLVPLHSCGGKSGVKRSPVDDAGDAAALLAPARAQALRDVGDRVAKPVNDLPHGFAHGDFFGGNLLVQGDRIVGVVDWDAAGPGRPPLLDFLHLWHMSRRRSSDLEWGSSIVNDLLPWARSGGDDVVRAFADRIGVELTPARLEALVAAYWLARLAYQLTRYADRAERSIWIERNVDLVLRELASRTWA